MKLTHTVAFILVVVGGLNWLLVGVFGWDIGQIFGGQDAIVSRIVYILVGLSAVFMIFSCKDCKCMMDCKCEAPKSDSANNPM